ncbi:hypothetical protein FACS1894187_20640 [Synergistales bacterium]|nr:hypothetical protein FACS1894187_20640 [Synergistales bacterium]
MKKIISAVFALSVLFMSAGIGGAAISTQEFADLCKKGTPDKVKAAINGGADVNAKNSDGWTALMVAAQNNPNPEVIATLLKNGADVNAKNSDGWTALMFAAQNNPNPEVIALLLERGADVNAKNIIGWTALMLAAANNPNPKVVAALLKNGADAQAIDYAGRMAIDYARDYAGGNEKLTGTAAFKQLQEASEVTIKR